MINRTIKPSIGSAMTYVVMVCALQILGIFPYQEVNGKNLQQYGVRHYDKQNGLSASSILEIYQSKDGYLWVGTYDGLNRFDGVEFKIFNRLNTPDLLSGNISKIYESSDGVLWIGTLGEGVQGFLDANLKHTKRGSFLPKKYVTDLAEDSNGRLYATTRSGLYIYQNSEWSELPVFDKTPAPLIQAIVIDEKDNALLATPNGIFKWDGLSCSLLDEMIPTDIQIHGFTYRKNHGLWFGSLQSGLFQYKNGKLYHYTTADGLFHDNIGDLVFDEDGNLWIGGRGSVSRFINGTFEHYQMKGQLIFSMAPDSEAGMWAGSYLQGLYRFGETKFSSYMNIDYNDESISGRAVIECDEQLLIGTNLGIYELSEGILEKSPKFEELDHILIRSLKPSSDGGIWVATHTGGIAKLNPDGSVIRYSADQGLQSITNRCILESKEGIVWIAGNNGLQILEKGEIRNYDPIQGYSILSLHELSDGSMLVTTDGDGFYLIRSDSIEHYTSKDGLYSDIVFYGHEDEFGNLWLPISDGGIAFFNDGKIKMLTEQDGLPHDSIFYLIDDKRGSYWMGCNSGIYAVKKDALLLRAEGGNVIPKSTRYDSIDGITAGGVTSVCHPYLDSKGSLWFPTTKGVVSVNPTESFSEKPLPKVIIESFETEVQSYDIYATKSIEIPAGTKRFTFGYTGLSFESGERTLYRVKMDGFDKEFIEIGTRREYAYTNLPPGTYTFMVNAANADGQWSDRINSLSFTLKPHFYQRPLFLIAVAVSILVLSFVIIRIRLSAIRNQQIRLQELVEQRTTDLKKAILKAESANKSKGRFLASVSHEVRNPMNGIVGISDLLLDSDLNEEQKKYVSIIQKSSRSLLTILNDLLDYSKINSQGIKLKEIPFSISSIIDETIALQEQHIRNKRLKIDIQIDPSLPDQLLGDPLRHRQVLNNLISNAIKFTDRGNISIQVDIVQKTLDAIEVKFSIKDSGIGISKENQSRLFEAYQQADDTIAHIYGGTGLGLAICRSLVEPMGGRIWVDSEPGKGSNFQFTTLLKTEKPKEMDRRTHPFPIERERLSELYSQLKVLVIDDEKLNLDIARLMFRKLGIDIKTASNVKEGLSILESSHFDILYLDYYMPEMDGATFANRIVHQKTKIHDTEIYIVAATGATSEQDKGILLKSGIKAIVNKPLTTQAITQSIDGYFTQVKTNLQG